jgi:hypothetical protein
VTPASQPVTVTVTVTVTVPCPGDRDRTCLQRPAPRLRATPKGARLNVLCARALVEIAGHLSPVALSSSSFFLQVCFHTNRLYWFYWCLFVHLLFIVSIPHRKKSTLVLN